MVCVNPKAIEQTAKVYHSIGEAFSELLNHYSIEELHFLIDHFRASIEMTKREIAKLTRE